MDPLRPFADVIRALWQSRASRAQPGSDTAKAATTPAVPATAAHTSARSEESLRSRLKSRISQVDPDDTRKVREAFVEAVLLWELGDRVAQDASFGEMVTQVSDQLATDAAISHRLRQLVLHISR